MADDAPKKKLSTTTKVLIGVGVVAGVGLAAHALKGKKAEAAPATGGGATPPPPTTTTPPAGTGGEVEPIYAAAPGFGVDVPLPVIGEHTKWWAFGGPNTVFPDFLTALGTQLGTQDSLPAAMPRPIDGDRVVAEASTLSANPSQMFVPAGIDPLAVWIAYVGPSQTDLGVPLTKEYIEQLRRAAGPSTRIAWVLSYSAPASVAKALALAGEQWVRARSDDPAQAADDAMIMLTSKTPQSVSDRLAQVPWATPTV